MRFQVFEHRIPSWGHRTPEWFRDVVELDPEGPLSRFRIGSIRDLEARVHQARELGAIAYVPAEAADAVVGTEDENPEPDMS